MEQVVGGEQKKSTSSLDQHKPVIINYLFTALSFWVDSFHPLTFLTDVLNSLYWDFVIPHL